MKKLKVLALESDRYSLNLLRSMLLMSGIEPARSTIDYDHAFTGLLAEDYDVAIMRGDTDRFDAPRMLRAVRQLRRPDLPVLMVFGSGSRVRLDTLTSLGRAAALIRPMSARQVADRVVALTRPKITFADYPKSDADIYEL